MTQLLSLRPTDRDGAAPPGGLWAALTRAADAPTVGSGDVWRGLGRRLLTGGAPAATGLWQGLAGRVDPAQYCPRAVPDVPEEQLVDGEQSFTVIRSPRGNYLRLTDPQRAIWHQMDGTRTVAQLATQAFLKFKQLLPVVDLVAALRDEGFLTDRPVGVYRAVAAGLEARTAEGWGRRLLRALAGKSWQFEWIDGFYGAIYRAGAWLLFTWPFLLLWAAVALAGLGAFVALLLGFGSPPAVLSSRGIGAELVALWCALLTSFFLHESSHALTVKHFRRDLRSGGFMLYFGMPAFFVDTSDIWRSPRPARMLVSAAGPMSDLFVGALAALLVLLRPDIVGASVAYKLAFTCYIATLFNANPLLELDGYFILVDWLRFPDLRRRAIAFVRGPLWAKLATPTANSAISEPKTKNQEPSARDRLSVLGSRFSREERLLAGYGALTLLYSLVAVAFAVQFWRAKLVGAIGALWDTGALPQRAVAVALVLLVVLPLLAGLLLAGLGVGRAALGWVLRRGYGRQPALLAGVAGALALVLAWLAWRASGGPYGWIATILPPLLWAVALSALLAVRPDYQRAAVAPTIQALLVVTGLAALAAAARAAGVPPAWWMLVDGLAFVFLLVAGFAALLDVDLRLSAPRELLITALLLMLAFAVGAAALLRVPPPDAAAALEVPAWWLNFLRVSAAAPAYFGALALALLLPHLFDLHDSRLIWSWLLMWAAALFQTAAYVTDLAGIVSALDVLAAALWAGTWLVHLATLRQIAPDEIAWPHEPSISEQQRLTRAFQFCYAGCYRLLRAVYGARRTRALDDRMDVLAATANWDVTLDRDRVRISVNVLALPLDLQGARYAEVLRYTVATIEEIAGATFARRAMQAAYDALPWPERETASRSCFPDTPWARELSDAFGDVREARLRMLRQVDQFLGCDDEELAALAHAIEERQALGGVELLAAGAVAPGVWVIEAGEVTVLRGGQVLAELHRGDAFGADRLDGAQPADPSYVTGMATSLLLIPAAEYRAVTQSAAAALGAANDTAATLRLLERVPMFANLPRNTLRGLAHIAQRRQFPARSVIVRQGTPSGVFYIIKSGRAAVLARGEVKGGEPAKVHPIAQLGPEEFFGELELLRGTPPLASVVAVTPLEALALPHTAVQAFIMGDGRVAKGLEQVGTGRLIALREGVAAAPG
jgi:putative peptide zinc metalloprotease protein